MSQSFKKEDLPSYFNGAAKFNEHLQKMRFNTSGLLPFFVADMDLAIDERLSAVIRETSERKNYSYQFRPDSYVEAITEGYRQQFQFNNAIEPFFVESGVLTALSLIMRAFSKTGDGVVFFSPAYHMFSHVIGKMDRQGLNSELLPTEGGFEVNWGELEELLQRPTSKILLLCNPHNPLGKVWGVETTERLIQLAKKHKVLLVSDEIHGDIDYSNTFRSALSIAQSTSDQVIAITSFAKTFGIPALAEGFIFTRNKVLREGILKQLDAFHAAGVNPFTVNVNQKAAELRADYLQDAIPLLKGKMEWLVDAVNGIDGLQAHYAQGTYQLWINASNSGFTPEEMEKRLIDKGQLAMAPGSWFSQQAGTYFRMNYASSDMMLEEGIQGLKRAFL